MNLSKLLQQAQRMGLVADPTTSDGWGRLVADVTDRIRSQLFDEQLALLDDPATWSVASCGRQAGKNYTVARLLIMTALGRREAQCVYVNATYGEARRIMWGDPVDGIPAVLRTLMDGRGYRLNETRLEVVFDNGSKIELLGADRGAWEKLRGNKFDLVCVDECQKLEDEGFRNAIDKILPDTFVARKGRFVGIGTPDEFCVGVFHDICTEATDPSTREPLYPQFVVHHWDAADNVRRPDIWEAMLAWKAERGLTDDDPIWLREKLGLWIRQDSSLILPVFEQSVWRGQLPPSVRARGGIYVPRSEDPAVYAGVDFGVNDAAAVVVGSVSREEGILRELHSNSRSGTNTKQLAEMLTTVRDRYKVSVFYGDDAGAQNIKDLRELYGINIREAGKLRGESKEFWIAEMRASLLDGTLQVLDGSKLHEELKVLAPDPAKLRKRKIEPRPGSDDHCYDAFRYLFRAVHTNHVRVPEAPLSDADREAQHRMDAKAEAMRRARQQATQRRR